MQHKVLMRMGANFSQRQWASRHLLPIQSGKFSAITKQKLPRKKEGKAASLEVNLWSNLGLSAVFQKCPLNTHTPGRNTSLIKKIHASINSFTPQRSFPHHPNEPQITASGSPWSWLGQARYGAFLKSSCFFIPRACGVCGMRCGFQELMSILVSKAYLLWNMPSLLPYCIYQVSKRPR